MSSTCCVCGDKITKKEKAIHMWEHQEKGELTPFPDINGTFTEPTERDIALHYKRTYNRKARVKHKCTVCNFAFNSHRSMLSHMYKYLKTEHSNTFSEELKKDIEESYLIHSISRHKHHLSHEIPKNVHKIKNREKLTAKWTKKLAVFEERLATILEESTTDGKKRKGYVQRKTNIKKMKIDETVEEELDEEELDEEDFEEELEIDVVNVSSKTGRKIPIPPLPLIQRLVDPVPPLLGPFSFTNE